MNRVCRVSQLLLLLLSQASSSNTALDCVLLLLRCYCTPCVLRSASSEQQSENHVDGHSKEYRHKNARFWRVEPPWSDPCRVRVHRRSSVPAVPRGVLSKLCRLRLWRLRHCFHRRAKVPARGERARPFPSWNSMCVMLLALQPHLPKDLCAQFNKIADGYHEAIARCMGANFLLIGYAIYDGWLTVNVRHHNPKYFLARCEVPSTWELSVSLDSWFVTDVQIHLPLDGHSCDLWSHLQRLLSRLQDDADGPHTRQYTHAHRRHPCCHRPVRRYL